MKSGPSYHQRYYQLKGWDAQKKKEMIHKRRGAYTAFGTVAMALNLIPVVSVFFTRTFCPSSNYIQLTKRVDSDLERRRRTLGLGHREQVIHRRQDADAGTGAECRDLARAGNAGSRGKEGVVEREKSTETWNKWKGVKSSELKWHRYVYD